MPFVQSSPILPVELLHQILSYTSQGTLASACRTSKTLYGIASPLLWKHLVLGPWKVHEDGKVIRDDKNKEILDENKENCGAIKSSRAEGQAMGTIVKTFSLYHHLFDWCQSIDRSTLQLPNAHTLHLYLSDKYRIHEDLKGHLCRLLRGARPKVIICHNACLRVLDFSAIGSRRLFEETQTLFFVSCAHQAEKCQLYPHVFRYESTTLKDIFWLFEPQSIGPSARSNSFSLGDFVRDIATLAIDFHQTRITFINSGVIGLLDTPWRHTPNKIHQKEIARDMKEVLEGKLKRSQNWSEEEKKQRIDSIRFMDFDEFLAEEQWWKYLDSEQVSKWKEVSENQFRKRHDFSDGADIVDEGDTVNH
ncbi:uncharacterized protein L199_007465 [Kwoniella botswanensis]|uniref:uncharacterized protein n=1 Tax=Kwoniella botswanensis TaxID=1268659 RepID=UPI00315D755C